MGEGKVVNISRMKLKRFYGGKLEIVGEKDRLRIIFQNEYLLAENSFERITVPDIITLLDKDTLRPISTEDIRNGMNVYVITIPCDEKWLNKEGLEIVGPKAFGLEI